MKVLFLDWDGVGNNSKTPSRQEGDKFIMADQFCTFLVNRIVDRTGCSVVLSSSWRHSPTWRQDMKDQGLVFDFLDRTTLEGNEILRGGQIKKWLDEHPEVERYAILDDYDDMLEEQKESFFKTTWLHGLTEEIADAVEEHLTK